MAQRKRKPLPPTVIEADRKAIRAILALPTYQPTNPAYGAEVLQRVDATLTQAEQADVRAQEARDQTRQVWIDTSYMAHDIVRHARAAIVVQFGEDSSEVQLVGLTRKSDYKPRSPRKPKES